MKETDPSSDAAASSLHLCCEVGAGWGCAHTHPALRLGALWVNTGLIWPLKQTKKPHHPAGGCSEQMGRGLLPWCTISITPNGCCAAAAEPQLRQRCPQQGSGRPQCCDLEGCDAWRPTACITSTGNNLHPCSRADFTRACPSARGVPGSGCEHLASRGDQRHYSKGGWN